MPDEQPEILAAWPSKSQSGQFPVSARWKTVLWWLFAAICLLAAVGSFLKGNTLSAPCYLVAAAVGLPPVSRRLPRKIPDNWKCFLILAGLMGAALLAKPPDATQMPPASQSGGSTSEVGHRE